MTLTLTSGDTAPTLTGTVSANIAGAALAIHIKRPDKTVLTKVGTITNAATGAWSAGAWSVGDLDQTGTHTFEVQVTFSDTRIQTFAVDSRGQAITFRVREQLA